MDKMNRYIYRAKRKDNGKWMQGYLLYCQHRAYIFWEDDEGMSHMAEVDSETICQYTGHEGVFEKDIFNDEDSYRYMVEWCEYTLAFEAVAIFTSELIGLGEFSKDEINIIGNVFDNPELMGIQED